MSNHGHGLPGLAAGVLLFEEVSQRSVRTPAQSGLRGGVAASRQVGCGICGKQYCMGIAWEKVTG
jgi:hypothetical protein